MRHAQGGALTAERWTFLEQVWLEAGVSFEAGEKASAIARDLRVSERSVGRWRRAWREGGVQALRSASRAAEPLSVAVAGHRYTTTGPSAHPAAKLLAPFRGASSTQGGEPSGLELTCPEGPSGTPGLVAVPDQVG
ncbi:hypothetical protein OQI_17790 [Streptomyces pharetrae CZA14]|uniref:Transposase n=1 Tax=Streptomyces pharetrae CZA14 TaxID=1144883 RepID=A0ABX3YH90_9ACTN|nr:hypothetical protein OQI_17790 [Streptomyces pharetrae CZA14]